MNEARLPELLERYFERELAGAEKAELEALLLASEEARARFWEETEWRALFHQWGEEQAGRVAAGCPLVALPSVRRRWVPRVLAWAAAVALLAGGAWMWRQQQEPVARIAQTAGVAEKLQRGDVLRRGTVKLAGGVAEIVLAKGARVVLEGPAHLEIKSENAVRLRSGRLRASVPPAAHGFTVHGAGFSAVDLGTEFGVIAAEEPEVHVFAGKVAVRGASERVLAKAGAVRIFHGTMEGIAARAELFPGGARLASAALSGHPATIAHFDFDGPLVNRASPGIAPVVNGAQRAEGRWPREGALAFTSPQDRVRFTVPGEMHALTLLAWVRVDSLPQVQSSLLMSESEQPGDVHWFLHRDGTAGFSIIGTDGRWHGAWTPPLFRREVFGKWLFLAVTFDDASGAATHYFNGRRVASQQLEKIGPLRPGMVELGNWGVRPGATLRASRNALKEPAGFARQLHGCVDEFALLSVPLSDAEIQRLYESGRASLSQ